MIHLGKCRCESPIAYCRKIKKVDVWFCVICLYEVHEKRISVHLKNFHPVDLLDKANKPRFHHVVNSDQVVVEWDFHLSIATLLFSSRYKNVLDNVGGSIDN